MADSALVFDLDGTLFDTVPEMLAAVSKAIAEEGVARDIDEDTARSYLGDGVSRFVKRAITGEHWANPDTQLHQAVMERMLGHYDKLLLSRNSVYAGVAETLAALQQDGWSLAVATNKLTRFTLPLLRSYLPDIGFKSVVCGDTLPQSKPDPAPLLHVCEALDIPPERSVMVGDSITDVKASQAAGYAAVVVVSYGYNQRTGLAGLPADLFIDEMKELPAASRELLAN